MNRTSDAEAALPLRWSSVIKYPFCCLSVHGQAAAQVHTISIQCVLLAIWSRTLSDGRLGSGDDGVNGVLSSVYLL